MKNKKKIVFLIVIGVVGLAAFFAVPKIPVLKVGEKSISYSKFLKVKGALDKFNSISKLNMGDDVAQIALLNLIEQKFLDILIDSADRNILFEAEKMVEKAIEQTPNLSLGEASEGLYNLSADDFKNLVLLPQAKKDLLDKYFKEKGKDILQAWASLYGTASIKVYYPGYYWDTKEYTIKKK